MAVHRRAEEEEAVDQSADENMELVKLEEDVNLMAQKLAQFRDTLPDQLQNTLTSILSAQIPVQLNLSHNVHEPSSTNPNPDSGASIKDDLEHADKIQTIKQKIIGNKSAMTSQLKRMEDCTSRIDKLDSFNKGIHPAFKTHCRFVN
ncbi:hypothetical protein SSX86_004742 [Deinandra increscens subsp. villosa]|uniref:Uncharacterized protein n=1 Tax=Deinandra increscens subsp. villosa TaxID=3103831 RepID=A0AAP0H682_9ASTR